MMSDELRSALKQYQRRHSRREWGVIIGGVIGFAVPWVFGFSWTNTLVWLVGLGVSMSFERVERRLKTMQIRLAQMHDTVDRIEGKEAEDHLIAELTDD